MRMSELLEGPEVTSYMRKQYAAKLKAEQEAFSSVQYCNTPGCANSEISWCHVIASSSQLEDICNDDGKLCWLPMRERDRFRFDPIWMTEHPGNTLTFRGFCNPCDYRIFKNIDKPLILSDEIYSLLAYRAISYKLWRSKVDEKAFELLPKAVSEVFDRSLEPEEAAEIRTHVAEMKSKQVEISSVTKEIQNKLDQLDYTFLTTRVFDLGEEIPIRYSVAHTFAHDIHCQSVTIPRSECFNPPLYFIHLLKIEGTTKLIFSWMSYIPKKYPDSWIKQINTISKSGHLPDILLRYMFVNNHGLVFDPKFEHSLNFESSQYLTSPVSGSFYANEKIQPSRVCYPPYFNLSWKAVPIEGNGRFFRIANELRTRLDI